MYFNEINKIYFVRYVLAHSYYLQISYTFGVKLIVDRFPWTTNQPKDITPPVFPLVFGCTTCDASIHYSKVFKTSVSKIIWSFLVYFNKSNNPFSLPQSSVIGSCNLMQEKDTYILSSSSWYLHGTQLLRCYIVKYLHIFVIQRFLFGVYTEHIMFCGIDYICVHLLFEIFYWILNMLQCCDFQFSVTKNNLYPCPKMCASCLVQSLVFQLSSKWCTQ